MVVTPLLRVVPPSPSNLAGDADASTTACFGEDIEIVVLATNAIGLGVERHANVARVSAARRDLERLADELTTRGSGLGARLATALRPAATWRLRTRELSLNEGIVVGILNLTTDSFSGDGVGRDLADAVAHGGRLRDAGATVIDVGGESARANRPVVDPEEEAGYVAPIIRALAAEGHCVSVDTYKPVVAEAALGAGAEIVNDISGLTAGTGAAEAAAAAGAGYVLNYSFSPPKQRPGVPPAYGDVVVESLAWFERRVDTLARLGLQRERIAVDPGIAFGKSHDEDLQVLRRLGEFTTFGLPVLLAHSRKNYIGSVVGSAPGERDLETHITTALAFEHGARIFRVHDVAGTRRAVAMAAALAEQPGKFAPDGESWPWRAGADAPHAFAEDSNAEAPAGQRW